MKRTLRASLLTAALVVAHFVLSSNSLAADFSAIWDGGNGNWGDFVHWSSNPNYPNNGGGFTYDATVNHGTVSLDRDITIQRLFFNGNHTSGQITGASSLTLNEGFTWNGGEIALGAGGVINLAAGSTSSLSSPFGAGQEFTSGTINNAGSFTVNQSSSFFGSNGIINNLAGGSWTMKAGSELGNFGVFNNAGSFIVVNDPQISPASVDCVFNNSGTVTIQTMSVGFFGFGIFRGGSSSGTFVVSKGFELYLGSIDSVVHPYTLTFGAAITGGGVTTIGASAALDIAGNSTINTTLSNGGLLTVESGATLSLNGPISHAGTIRLNGGTITTVQTLGLASSLSGSGTINGNVSASYATISPGASAGVITINGQLSLLNNAKLVMEIGGLTQGTEYDYLHVNGAVGLDGILELHMINGFQGKINPKESFAILTSTDLSGAFDNIANGDRLTTVDGTVSFQVNYGRDSLFDPDDIVLSDPQAVPEPASLMLLAVGIAVLGVVRFRKR